MLLSDYTSGTVTSSGKIITGAGTGWSAADFAEGDIFIAEGYWAIVESVDSNTQLTLVDWAGPVLTNSVYRLRYMSDGSRVSAQARQLIDMLGGSGNIEALSGLAGLPGMVPVFTGPGTMELKSYTAGLVPKGDWDTNEIYSQGDLVTYLDNAFGSIVNNNQGNQPPSTSDSDSNWQFFPTAPGPEGPEGPPGPSNSLSIGTVAGGDTASATITGTAPSQTLNLVLPKGDDGDPGSAGWTPVFAVVADGARYVQQVVDWAGGTGAKPTTGQYVGPSGFVSSIGDAVNIRGASGSGTGDVVGPASAIDGEMVIFDGVTGKLVKGGGAPFSGNYGDLSNRPTLGTAAAANTGDFATAAQGTKADTAIQPEDLGSAAGADISDFATAAQGAKADAALRYVSAIGSGEDLDTYTTPGVYVQNQSAGASGGTNYPVANAGMLEVLDGGGATNVQTVQRYTEYSQPPMVWQRMRRNSGNWSAWVELASADDIATKVTKANDTGLGGFTAISKNLGNLGSAVTLSPVGGNGQHGTNNAAVTITAPSVAGVYTIVLEIVNSATAGAVTLAGFTKTDGAPFTTANGDKFQVVITKTNSMTTASVVAAQ